MSPTASDLRTAPLVVHSTWCSSPDLRSYTNPLIFSPNPLDMSGCAFNHDTSSRRLSSRLFMPLSAMTFVFYFIPSLCLPYRNSTKRHLFNFNLWLRMSFQKLRADIRVYEVSRTTIWFDSISAVLFYTAESVDLPVWYTTTKSSKPWVTASRVMISLNTGCGCPAIVRSTKASPILRPKMRSGTTRGSQQQTDRFLLACHKACALKLP